MLKIVSSPVELSAHFLSEIVVPLHDSSISVYPDLLVSPTDIIISPAESFHFVWNSSSPPAVLSRNLA